MNSDIKKNLIAQRAASEEIENRINKEEHEEDIQEQEIADLKRKSLLIRSRLKTVGDCSTNGGIALGDRSNAQLVQKDDPPECAKSLPSYADVTEKNIAFLDERGLLDTEFDTLFTPEALERIERELCSPIAREKWETWDFVAVLCGGIAGIVADCFTGGIDDQLKKWFSGVHIKADSNVAIDYQGPGFGGPYHRALSSGHDVLRVFVALWQIKTGNFTGLKQTVGGFERIVSGANQYGNPFNTYEGLDAFLVWIKHLASDIVTPNSLPFPGMSFLMDMPNHEIRKFAIEMYRNGFNLRQLLAQFLTPALVEVVVRAYVLAREFRRTGKILYPSARRLKTTEMLLASHGIVMAFNVGKVVIRSNAEGPLALRKLNLPEIVMAVRYFIPFVVKRFKLNDPVEILRRNAKHIDEGYDRLIQSLKSEMESDTEFLAFLHNGEVITI